MGIFIIAGTLPLVVLVVFFSKTYVFSVLLCVFYSVLSMTAESSFGVLPKWMCWLMPIPLTTLWSAGNLTAHDAMDGVGMLDYLIPTTFQTIIILAVIAFVYGYGGMFASRNAALANIYPVTASLGLIDYRSYDSAVHWNVLTCLLSMIAALVISAVFIFTAKGNVPVKKAKKHKKAVAKKGW